ncbi:peptide ABC transporter permease [Paenibacillus sp. J31TS4]|uniref:ABC transporter permease n=1 Tax=Paenibacillus sp. J31TS4 TaxID=2807195 RepID=UPI001B19CC2A|nr:ABC transporter permease [Paenibacillus sp. J31TS4]GIP41215.1 peptide ABC transporter permease [Paenibacillus sp. J31TS4]
MVPMIARKLLELVLVIFFVTLIVFFTFRLLPGDPALLKLGQDPTPEAVAAIRAEMGLDRPLLSQYLHWIGDLVRGDFGASSLDGKPVLSLLAEKVPKTLELAVLGTLLSLFIAIPAGVLAAVYRYSWVDRLMRSVSLFGFSVPAYWLAILLMLIFAYKVHLLPAGGYASLAENPWLHLKGLVLPVLTVGIINAAQVFRFLRSGMLDIVNQDYIRTARAKGVSEALVIGKHVARNTLPGLVTVVTLNFSLLLSGMVITEQIFAWPGLGWLMIQSILSRDYEVVQGAVLLSAVFIVVMNLVGDLINAMLDPRIKYN